MAGTIFGSNGLLLASSQEYKEQIANELFRLISIGSAPILSRTLTTPPSPQNIDSYYIVPAGATGAWAGKTNQIAYPVIGLSGLPTGTWKFWQPFTGLTVFSVSGGTIFFNGTNWQTVAGAGDMLVAEYGGSATGIVAKADEIAGNPGSDTFYGKESGNKGFFGFFPKVLSTPLTNLSTSTGGAITATDNVLQGFGKLQKQLNDLSTGVTDGDKGDVVVSNSGATWTVETGTTADSIVRLDGAAKLPAIDGSQLTNLPVLSATQIRDSLTTLTGSNRLDASAIKDLPGGGGSVEDSWPIAIFALTANDPRLEGTNFPKTLTLPPFPTGVTINKISGLINSLNSGSAVLSIQNSTTTISGLGSLNCTTTVLADQLATANNILSAGGRLRISFSSITGLINISFRIDYTENP